MLKRVCFLLATASLARNGGPVAVEVRRCTRDPSLRAVRRVAAEFADVLQRHGRLFQRSGRMRADPAE